MRRRIRTTTGVALLLLLLLLTGCSKDLYHELQPGDCVREKGLGLDWEGGIERIDCSEHDPLDFANRTWIVKAAGGVDMVDAQCPAFGSIIVDGDYAVCYSSGR